MSNDYNRVAPEPSLSEEQRKDAFLLFDNLKFLQHIDSDLATTITGALGKNPSPEDIANLGKEYRSQLEAAGSKFHAKFSAVENSSGAIRPNPYQLAEDPASNYQDDMFDALKSDLPKGEKIKIKEVNGQRQGIMKKEAWYNRFASIIGPMNTKGQKPPFEKRLLVGIAKMINGAARLLGRQKPIPYNEFSTLANGNPPYASKIKIDNTQMIEMGMPTIVRANETSTSKSVCSVSPVFKENITKMTSDGKKFLYVSLLENKPEETPHVEALKGLEAPDNSFYFMQMPPKHQIHKIEKALETSENKAETLKEMITGNNNNFFVSDKIKASFGPAGKFDEMVGKITAVAANQFGGDPFNMVNFVSATLTYQVQQKLKPSQMCHVCKDGIDRGHAFKLNFVTLLKAMGHSNMPDLDHNVRAVTVAGRNINDNIETAVNFSKCEQTTIASAFNEVTKEISAIITSPGIAPVSAPTMSNTEPDSARPQPIEIPEREFDFREALEKIQELSHEDRDDKPDPNSDLENEGTFGPKPRSGPEGP